jgi:hypothetical protein
MALMGPRHRHRELGAIRARTIDSMARHRDSPGTGWNLSCPAAKLSLGGFRPHSFPNRQARKSKLKSAYLSNIKKSNQLPAHAILYLISRRYIVIKFAIDSAGEIVIREDDADGATAPETLRQQDRDIRTSGERRFARTPKGTLLRPTDAVEKNSQVHEQMGH